MIHRLTHVHQGITYQLRSRNYAEHALAYAMAANAGVVKAIVSFYRIDSIGLGFRTI